MRGHKHKLTKAGETNHHQLNKGKIAPPIVASDNPAETDVEPTDAEGSVCVGSQTNGAAMNYINAHLEDP